MRQDCNIALQPGQYDKTHPYKKYKKIGWVWWHMPIVPATPEAEVEQSFDPRRQRLQ